MQSGEAFWTSQMEPVRKYMTQKPMTGLKGLQNKVTFLLAQSI